MRISGFASGMDIDSMVQQMMKAKRIPVDKLGQKKQVLEWQRESYRELNAKMVNFRNNKLFNYNKVSTFSQVKSEVTGDTTAVSAKAVGNAVNGTMTIKVIDLAKPCNNTGSDIRSTGKSIDVTKILMDQKANFSAEGESVITNGMDISFKINGKQVNIDPNTMSMNDVISAINSQTDVQAVYDEGTGKVLLSTKETGKNSKIEITDDTQGFMSNVLKITNSSATGDDASFELNGLLTTRPSNSFTINGVEIKLNAKSTTSTTTITTSKDVDKIVNDIKDFINEYNDLIKLLNEKTKETRYRDFKPLTDDQRKELKESEITNWEAKAKSGLLAGDSILTKVLADMRLSIASEVSSTGNIKQIAAVGIETGTYKEVGKLYLKNEDKLRDALANDPDSVIALFTSNPPPTTDANGESVPPAHKALGIFQRLYNDVKTALDEMNKKAGTSSYSTSLSDTLNPESTIGKSIKALTDKMRTQNDNLKMLETRYYRQFTAMEVAMNKFNSQSASLFGMTNS